MGKEIVYSTEFFCFRCKKPAIINLYSDDPSLELTDSFKKEVEGWGKHYHWVDNHQICAICGELVVSGSEELNLIQTEVMLSDVHPLYIEWNKDPEHGLLTVHNTCSQAMFNGKNAE